MTSDTLSIKESIGEEVDKMSEPTEPKNEVVEESKEVESADETKEITQEETFAEKGELQGKTPEELEEIYKNWQRSYTEKRQKETQELKEYREKLAKLEAQKPEQDRKVEDVRDDMNKATEDVELGKMSVEEYTKHMRKLMAEEARQIAREEFQTLSKEQQENQYQEQAYQDFLNADDKGRLNPNSPTKDETLIREVQDHLAKELDKHIKETGTAKGFDTTTLAKAKIKEYDDKLDEIVKNRTKKSTQMAAARAAKSRKAATKGTNANSAPVEGNSIRDILAEAVDASER